MNMYFNSNIICFQGYVQAINLCVKKLSLFILFSLFKKYFSFLSKKKIPTARSPVFRAMLSNLLIKFKYTSILQNYQKSFITENNTNV